MSDAQTQSEVEPGDEIVNILQLGMRVGLNSQGCM